MKNERECEKETFEVFCTVCDAVVAVASTKNGAEASKRKHQQKYGHRLHLFA